MCLPACETRLRSLFSRRRFLAGALAAPALTGGAAADPEALPGRFRFRRVVDLTHELHPAFPTFSGTPQFQARPLHQRDRDGYSDQEWTLAEHTGTHLDAPGHFSDGITAEAIPAARLVGPLAVIDLSARAAGDPDTELTADDLRAWEKRHRRLPPGCVVAMHSGWSAHVTGPRYRNADAAGKLHFPGFHVSAAEFLITERDAVGIAVDTLSLDRGLSRDFATHVRWLGSGRWGLECVANLDRVPAHGAVIVVGAPKVRGASGGPGRVFALV
jgi:kynurenine formamidase